MSVKEYMKRGRFGEITRSDIFTFCHIKFAMPLGYPK